MFSVLAVMLNYIYRHVLLYMLSFSWSSTHVLLRTIGPPSVGGPFFIGAAYRV